MKIEVGKVLKAHGIKGELKLDCYLDDASMLVGQKQLYIGSKTYSVEYIRADKRFCYVKLTDVCDRNAAEALCDWTVLADKENISLPSDRYFVEDLIGCSVIKDDGEAVGTVKDVLQYGAADVFVCDRSDGTVSFPFVKEIVSVNLQLKCIVVSSKRFDEVAVYED